VGELLHCALRAILLGEAEPGVNQEDDRDNHAIGQVLGGEREDGRHEQEVDQRALELPRQDAQGRPLRRQRVRSILLAALHDVGLV